MSCFQGLFFCPDAASLLLHNFCIYHIDAPGHEVSTAIAFFFMLWNLDCCLFVCIFIAHWCFFGDSNGFCLPLFKSSCSWELT